jgi:hypothetical protein
MLPTLFILSRPEPASLSLMVDYDDRFANIYILNGIFLMLIMLYLIAAIAIIRNWSFGGFSKNILRIFKSGT